jgi:WS/DGAT/MGAT family acyltransferase
MIETLGGLDALFLHLETPEMPMHVASMHYYRLPPRSRVVPLERVKAHMRERLHLSPVFTRKLAATPMRLANPAWVEDTEFDLDYHVRRVILPAPGTHEQFEQCVAELHSRPMDRSRPLWEFYVIEGLQRKGLVGFYSKLHHAAIDGKAGVVLAQAILDLAPKGRRVEPPPAREPSTPAGTTALLRTALSSQVKQTRRLVNLLPGLLKAGTQAAGDVISESIGSLRGRHGFGPPLLGPHTRLNVSIDGRRAFATAEIPIADLKKVAHAFDGTLNDVVLALCSSALRRYLDSFNELPEEPLVAWVPVSLRPAGDTSQNTQATMFRVPLGTHIADPRERFQAIKAATAEMKAAVASFKGSIPTDFPSLGMPWLLPGLASLYGRTRLADRIRPPANVVISNVPGPAVPLYLAGAQMLTYYPMSIVTHGMALNITVESYTDKLFFGMIACARAVPEVAQLAAWIEDAHRELTELAASARPAAAGAPAAKRARKPGAAAGATKPARKAPANRIPRKAVKK